MNSFNNKKFLYSICGMILLSAIVVFLTQNSCKAISNRTKIGSLGGRAGGGVSPSHIAAYEDRRALEAYEYRNAQIDSKKIDYITSNHNNAALLYYQAFLLLPELDDDIYKKIKGVCKGAEPDKQLKILLGKCLPSMELFEAASQIPDCTWGLLSEEKISSAFLNRNAVNLIYIVTTDARILSAEGHYRQALEQCLRLRQFANHLSHVSQLWASSWEANGMALMTINSVLNAMPPEVDTLSWLRGRLSVVKVEKEFLDVYLNSILDTILTDIIGSSQTYAEETRLDTIEATQNLFGSIFAILDSEMSAGQKLAEIKKIKIADRYPDNPFMNMSDELRKEIKSIMYPEIDNEDMFQEDVLVKLKDVINKSVSDKETAELIYNYFKRKHDIDKIILSDVSQDQKFMDKITEIKRLSHERSEAEKLADIFMSKGPEYLGLPITSIFEIQIEQMYLTNSTKTAVELYIILARTGQLPHELPGYLPKDPYTNQNLIYEITDDGFVLSCNSDGFERGKERFAFKAQRPAR